MSLVEIGILAAIAAGISLIPNRNWRSWFIFGVSSLTIYALQPAVALRHFAFWFPTIAIGLVFCSWLVLRPGGASISRQDRVAFVLTLALLFGIDLSGRLPLGTWLVSGGSPSPGTLMAGLFGLAGIGWFISRSPDGKRAALWALALSIIGLFVAQKWNPAGVSLSRGIRLFTSQSTELASSGDITWLGYSYIAFRILHVIRDRQAGRILDLGYRDFVIYVLFFPALVAGPIDRVERFKKDLESTLRPGAEDLLQGGLRIARGCFKKFVLADALALFALNELNAPFVQSGGWAWILLYAYSFRLLLDFSGYTDIAIGLGRLMGFSLPENFQRPYLKADLTAFWNSWHITLAQWFRAYVFNPLTRSLRGRISGEFTWLVILLGQFVTMALIGLWHGVTWNFAIWGAWHGMGLFVHNRWTAYRRGRGTTATPGRFAIVQHALGILFTFHFVTLGWVWFALPNVDMSFQTLQKLLGL